MKALLRNPACLIGILLVVLHLVVAIGAPWVAPYAPTSLLDAPLEPENPVPEDPEVVRLSQRVSQMSLPPLTPLTSTA